MAKDPDRRSTDDVWGSADLVAAVVRAAATADGFDRPVMSSAGVCVTNCS